MGCAIPGFRRPLMSIVPSRLSRIALILALVAGMFGGRLRAATDVTITVTQAGVPVEGAFVALVGSGSTKFAAVANASGQAVFSQVPDGSYVAYASAST